MDLLQPGRQAFLKLNCAALPSELIESELFGYEKGAFTGAMVDKPGKFELAQDGTILLDEIGDMDTRLQAKLLQVLQDGEVQPLGSSRIIKVNVRIMAATHRDLHAAIAQGTFPGRSLLPAQCDQHHHSPAARAPPRDHFSC